MTEAEIEQLVKNALYDVAPDIASEPIDADADFREQFEIDSMDFLNFVIALHKSTGVEISEAEYDEVRSLSRATAFLKQRLAGSPGELPAA